MAHRALLWLSLVLICALAGCSKRDAGSAVLDYVDTDFTSLNPEAAAKATTDLAPLMGAGQAGEPRLLTMVGGDVLGVWASAKPVQVVVSRFDKSGTSIWQASMPLREGVSVQAIALGDAKQQATFGGSVLTIGLDDQRTASVRKLIFLLSSQGPALARAELGNGQVANAKALADFPGLMVLPGQLGSKQLAEQVKATVYLSAAERAADRGKPSVQSHLRQLAGGTSRVLAEAAAELLTLPVK